MENAVLEVRGKRGGHYFTEDNGYFYKVKEKASNKRWKLVCKNRNCRGTAALLNPEGVKQIEAKCPHSCEPDFLFLETNKLHEQILNRCKTELTPSSEIFTEECTKK